MTWIIGNWEVHPDTSTLQCGSDTRHLTPRAMEVLVYLTEHSAATVSVETLLGQFWPNPQVGEAAVYKIITELRHALDEDSKQPRYLQTVPKRGYRLKARIVEDSQSEVGEFDPPSDSVNGRYPRMTIAALSAVVLVSLFAAFVPSQDALLTSPLDSDQNQTIAVLNFRSIDEHPENDYLIEGVPTSMLKVLSYIDRLEIVDPSQSEKHSTVHNTIQEIGSVLGVDYLVDGAFVEIDNQIEISVYLYDAKTGASIHTFNDSVPIENASVLLQSVTADMLSAFEIFLDFDEDHQSVMNEIGTRNVEAYIAITKAWEHRLRGDRGSLNTAISLYRDATEIDPGFVYAYARMATALGDLGFLTFSSGGRKELRAQITEIRNIVTGIDPNSPELAQIEFSETRLSPNSWHDLEAQSRIRVQAAGIPKEADFNYMLYADQLLSAHLFIEAAAYLDVYAKFEPTDPWLHGRRTRLTSITQGPLLGISLAEKMVALFPDDPWRQMSLVNQNSLASQFEQADKHLKRLQAIDSGGGLYMSAKLYLAALKGDLKLGTAQLENSLDPNGPFTNGIVYFMLGDIENGLKHWRQIPPEQGEIVGRLTIDAESYISNDIVADPRFQQYLEERGIGKSWTAFMREKVAELATTTGIEPSDSVPQLVYAN